MKASVNHRSTGTYVLDDSGNIIAEVYERHAGKSREESLAMATQFAAAPDLHLVATVAVDYGTMLPNGFREKYGLDAKVNLKDFLAKIAKNAIAKAEGIKP